MHLFHLVFFFLLTLLSKAMLTHYAVHDWSYLPCWQWTMYRDAVDIRRCGVFKLPHCPVYFFVFWAQGFKPKNKHTQTHTRGISNPVTFPKRPPHGHLRRSCYGVANKDCRRADGLANDVHTEWSPDITSINVNGHGFKIYNFAGG